MYNKAEIISLLNMPFEEFSASVMKEAKAVSRANGNKLKIAAMLGYSNICKNHCLYCGMRADNKTISRYRIAAEDIIASAKSARGEGINRIFLISGEDPKYDFDSLLKVVSEAKKLKMFISLAAGELEQSQYDELKSSGLDEYVMKFEMSDREDFNRLNPSTDYDKRMLAIERIKKSGLLLASGNIVGYPGHTVEHLAEDILLTVKLNVSWVPIVPFMPAVNTPLGKEPRGDYKMNLRAISILRLMLPSGTRITAQQPGEDMSKGLGGHDGNLAALNAGGDILFTDLLPAAQAKNFSVVDNRMLKSLDFLRALADEAGMKIDIDK